MGAHDADTRSQGRKKNKLKLKEKIEKNKQTN